jgi:hypothetical protein
LYFIKKQVHLTILEPFMKRQTIWGYALFAVLILAACQPKERESATTDLTQYVDQRIGTGGHGHVFMGANVPYGFVQLGPTSIPQKWDWTSGYHISDTTCIGFSHTHLSGTGIGDLADVTLMPVVGEITPGRGTEEAPLSGQASYFQHKNERMYPGFYATHLDRYNVDVALTATARVGFHRYQYPVGKQQRVLLDLRNGTCWDRPTHCKITQKDSITLEGYRFSVGWANNQKLFFTMIFSAPVRSIQYMDEHLKAVKEETSVRYAMIDFDVAQKEQPLYVKVALSPVSSQNANKNMLAELPNWDFEATAQAAKGAWNNALQKIQITSKEKSVLRNFYTAMYHYMIAPSVGNEMIKTAEASFTDFMHYYHIDLMNPKLLCGLFLGSMMAFLFCGLTMNAVGRAAGKMVDEVRHQFQTIKGILTGEAEPDYARCVEISTKGAQKEMILPALLAIIAPMLTGVLLGVAGVMGLLTGGLASGFILAIFMANSGGAWDNAKKYIEEGHYGGKGSEVHKASITGDTVGDPFKDTSGPSLNILIKLMSMVAIVMVGLTLAFS